MRMFDLNDMMFRLLVAAILGAIIGLERELTHKAAGLRTHMLVSMGSCIFMVLSMTNLAELSNFHALTNSAMITNVNYDPSRIGAQIVTGIGFIGGGALLKEGNSIRGITTAASLWNTAGVGMLVGVGLHGLAVFATLIAVIILYTMGKIPWVKEYKRFKDKEVLRLTVHVRESHEEGVIAYIEDQLEERIKSVERLRLKTEESLEEPLIMLGYEVDIRHHFTPWNKWKRSLKRLNGVEKIALSFENEAP